MSRNPLITRYLTIGHSIFRQTVAAAIVCLGSGDSNSCLRIHQEETQAKINGQKPDAMNARRFAAAYLLSSQRRTSHHSFGGRFPATFTLR